MIEGFFGLPAEGEVVHQAAQKPGVALIEAFAQKLLSWPIDVPAMQVADRSRGSGHALLTKAAELKAAHGETIPPAAQHRHQRVTRLVQKSLVFLHGLGPFLLTDLLRHGRRPGAERP